MTCAVFEWLERTMIPVVIIGPFQDGENMGPFSGMGFARRTSSRPCDKWTKDDSDTFAAEKALKVLDRPNIVAWLTIDANISIKKLISLPVGIFHTRVVAPGLDPKCPIDFVVDQMVKSKAPFNESMLFIEKLATNKAELKSAIKRDSTKCFPKKVALLRTPFDNVSRHYRMLLFQAFKTSFPKGVDSLYIHPNLSLKERRKIGSEYWYDLSRAQYVLSPPGYGFDCYRTWETVAAGSIPIVEGRYMDSLYDGLPVLVVQNMVTDVTPDLLKRRYFELSCDGRYRHWEKLTVSYWLDLVRYLSQTGKLPPIHSPLRGVMT